MNQKIKKYRMLLMAILPFTFLNSCENEKVLDNQTSGSIKVLIDETYKPVMEQQIKIFTSRYPEAKILAEYKPEAECIKTFLEDSTRVVFVTRDLTNEEKAYGETKKFITKSMPMARDAVAFITSKANQNPVFKIADLRKILLGDSTQKKYQIVFDNQSSSTVRYITDSILNGKKITGNVFATKTSEEVINYVSKNKNAIGIVGVSWIADYSDSTTETFLSKINVAGIWGDTDSSLDYIKPYQAYIGLKEYPCTRNLYFISKETWAGLGTGLVNYLCKDGQLVFKQAKMFPLRVNVLLREANVH
jgi:phosphate transport system substrate-binding protein